jgi:DNA invertase Pin-like site-specific DNA recombinase
MTRAVIYVRVSTEQQTAQNQVEVLQEVAWRSGTAPCGVKSPGWIADPEMASVG